ncbi:MAG: hypothetical protein J2P17_11445 [Mycobacterium sp.]|nr:hypothetical protein [Mycobacterium sp.]
MSQTAKQSYTAISRTIYIQSTVSELVPTMLQEMQPWSSRSADVELPGHHGATATLHPKTGITEYS